MTSQKTKSDKFFNFICTVFLQSITVSGYILFKEKLLGVSIQFRAEERHAAHKIVGMLMPTVFRVLFLVF